MPLAEITYWPFANEHPDALLATAVGFLLLGLLLFKVNIPYLSAPYLRGVLNDRSTQIEGNHNQVQSALGDAKRVRDDYALRVQQIEAESRLHIEAAVREADAAREQIIADALAAAEALKRRSEEEIRREQTRQRIILRQQIVQTTLDAAEQAIRGNSGEAVQHQMIQDFIVRAGGEQANGQPAPNSNVSPGAIQSQTQSQGGA